jgi:hypothetical protein
MKRIFARRPRASMIVAVIALIAAMSGSAVAGSKFLSTKKFQKFRNNAVQRLVYANNGAVVPPTGPTNFRTVSVACPPGFHPLGGGVRVAPNDARIWATDGFLTAGGYAAQIVNTTPATNGSAVVNVSCAAGNASGPPATP